MGSGPLKCASLVGPFVDGKQEGPAAGDDGSHPGHRRIPTRLQLKRVSRREVDDGLKRSLPELRDEQIRAHALVAIGRVKRHLCPSFQALVSSVAAAIEHRTEGFVLGVGGNMFKLAGSVILFGVFSAFVIAMIKTVL